MGVAIVTDSTSDIEPASARADGIAVVPLFVVFGDRSYKDYVDLSRDDFYRKLASESALPITSQPTAAMFEEAFAGPVAAGDDVLCIVISSKLSGTINAATAAAQQVGAAKVRVYDSGTVAGGLGMMVRHAHALAQRGASIEEIVASLDAWSASQHIYACLSDLSHLQRTGRIGAAQAALGTMMKIVPVLTIENGAVAAKTKVRTFARAQETMLDLILKDAPPIPEAHFVVMHTNAPALAQTAAEKLRGRLGGQKPAQLAIWEAGPVIATHGGPGAVGIFVARGA